MKFKGFILSNITHLKTLTLERIILIFLRRGLSPEGLGSER